MIYYQNQWRHQRQIDRYSILTGESTLTLDSRTKIQQPHIIDGVNKRRDSTRAGILGVLAYVSIAIGAITTNNEKFQPALEETVQPSIMQMYESAEYIEFLENERSGQALLSEREEQNQLRNFVSILPLDAYAQASQ